MIVPTSAWGCLFKHMLETPNRTQISEVEHGVYSSLENLV
jgi:hypothetical protein